MPLRKMTPIVKLEYAAEEVVKASLPLLAGFSRSQCTHTSVHSLRDWPHLPKEQSPSLGLEHGCLRDSICSWTWNRRSGGHCAGILAQYGRGAFHPHLAAAGCFWVTQPGCKGQGRVSGQTCQNHRSNLTVGCEASSGRHAGHSVLGFSSN